MKKSNQKKAISIPFEWIFAVILGGIIIFIAIYAATRGVGTGNKVANTQVIARLEGYLSPYETGTASGETDEIHFSSPSRIFFDRCEADSSPPFGRQFISFTQKMFNKYQDKSDYIELKSKYVFANDTTEGKDFYITSMPFFMGYKVSDLILIYTDKYCFIQAPNDIVQNVERLKLKNINFSDEFNCSGIKVCFDMNDNKCEVKVFSNDEGNYEYGKIEKYNKKTKRYEDIYYIGNLMYAGIVSSNDLYECNVKRLMSKFVELGKVYLGKIKILEMNSCSSNVAAKLNPLIEAADNLRSSQTLLNFIQEIEDIKIINDAAMEGCKLFGTE